MAGFFSLGRGGGGDNSTSPPPLTTTQLLEVGGGSSSNNTNNPTTAGHHHQISPESWFLYRNEEITYNKGFELWQHPQLESQPQPQQFMQQEQDHHQTTHRPQHSDHHQDLYSSAVGLGVGPSTTTTRATQIDHENPTHHNNSSSSTGGDRSGGSGYNLMVLKASCPPGGGVSCQDCGNQAKKDCPYMRCRTCCKSRGFQCSTHVRSTWIPAAKRRERHQQIAALQQEIGGGGGRDVHGSTTKRSRENIVNPNVVGSSSSALVRSRLPVTAPTTVTGMELGNFPPEISSPAVFRCVKVSSYDDGGDDQIAYQTAVNIGGHVFKGILYDQGLDHSGGDSSSGTGGPSSSTMGGGGGGGAAGSSVGSMALVTNSPALNFFDPSSLYPPAAAQQLSSFMAGTQFFPNQRP